MLYPFISSHCQHQDLCSILILDLLEYIFSLVYIFSAGKSRNLSVMEGPSLCLFIKSKGKFQSTPLILELLEISLIVTAVESRKISEGGAPGCTCIYLFKTKGIKYKLLEGAGAVKI